MLSFDSKPLRKVHFTGIFGSGMSGLAQFLAWSGVNVSGSDRLSGQESASTISAGLIKAGCILCSQDGSGVVDGTDAVVYSTAIEDANPDMAAARSRGIPLLHRSDLLMLISRTKKTIAIAGTSGKSTVTALIFHLLQACGKRPSLICGANLHALVNLGLVGNAVCDSSDLLVIETDESDGTVVKYKPWITLLTSISKDHKPIPEIFELFRIVATQSDVVFKNGDDPGLKAIPSFQTYGILPENDFHPASVVSTTPKATFIKDSITFQVNYPGTYMVLNMLSAVAVASYCGCDLKECAESLPRYQGLQRRFDKIETRRGVTVIDDFAHNPEKIKAVLETVQQEASRVFVLFQPHGFAPTEFMQKELVEVFSNAMRPQDYLYMLPIYYAGGTVRKTISSEIIAEEIRVKSKLSENIVAPLHRDDAVTEIGKRCGYGDTIIVLGARDPSLPLFAQSIANGI